MESKLIEEMEEYAQKENVPIMLKDGIEFLLDFIKEKEINSILEIGTAIGYSSIRMALINKNISVVTIERDEIRYKKAIENINQINLNNQIKVIYDDAFNVELDNKFDLIFIDAAKGKNIEFFEKFSKNLNKDGYIITDNLKFHGMVDKDLNEIESRNVRGLVRKIRNYVDWLKSNDNFETNFYDIGDGISISRRK